MMTNDNDTLYAGQQNAGQQNNANGEKKKLFKDSVIAKVMGSATAGMALGAGAAYAAEHFHKGAEDDSTAAEEQAQQNDAAQQNGPTVEERLAELEEKERIREQQEQERQRAEEERQQRELQRQREEQQRQRQESQRAQKAKEEDDDEPKIKEETNFMENHEVKIEGVTEETREDGTTVQIYHGTVDGHQANFLADGNGNVVAAAVDSNDNGDIDNNEIIDLRNNHITTQQLSTHQTFGSETEVSVVAVRNNVEMGDETVDVAVVSVNGEPRVLIDTDQNGEENIIAADAKKNG
ncbi:MAG: hypothetical protein ACI3YC_00305, partial [Alloprevotella sp.]